MSEEERKKAYNNLMMGQQYNNGKDKDPHVVSKVVVTVSPLYDSFPLVYTVATADFGHSIDHKRYMKYEGVIAKPPSNTAHLCEIPDDLGKNLNENALPRDNLAIALLVNLEAGGCDVLTKATNALKLQEDIAKNLKYVLFYNNNPNNPGAIATLSLGRSASRMLAPFTKEPTLSPTDESSTRTSSAVSSAPSATLTDIFTGPSDDDWITNKVTNKDNNDTKTDDEFLDIDNEEGNDDGLEDYILLHERERNENRQELIDNDTMVFVSLSTSAGVKILSKIDEKVKSNAYNNGTMIANPEFLQVGFRQWGMQMNLVREGREDPRPLPGGGYGSNNIKNIGSGDYNKGYDKGGDPGLKITDDDNRKWNGGRRSGSYSDNAPSTFTILKFILFGLLIISPCLRAVHLWWAGGGRIRFRHSEDEDNRIVGLQYIPPMDNWFGAYEPAERERVHDRLTHEEVMSLPEIIYKKPCFADEYDNNEVKNKKDDKHIYNENDDKSENSEDNCTVNADDSDEFKNGDSTALGANMTTSPVDWQATDDDRSDAMSYSSSPEGQSFSLPPLPTSPERVISTPASTNTNTEGSPDEEQPVDAIQSFRTQRRLRAFTTTTCTTCSICIDEFEEGEKVRLLPLCGHAFHTECILPWLKDRQGCCPMCKTGVLEDSNCSSTSDDDDDDSNRNGNGTGGTESTRVEL